MLIIAQGSYFMKTYKYMRTLIHQQSFFYYAGLVVVVPFIFKMVALIVWD